MDKTKFPKPIFHKPLRDLTGDTSAALFLGQLIFLSNTTPDEFLSYGRIRKPADEWNDFFGFERSEMDRVNSICKSRKLVEIKRMGVPATNHYRVDKKEISRQLSVCGIPANWIAEILQTGLRETSKQDSQHSANINSNKDIEKPFETKKSPLPPKGGMGKELFKTWKDTPQEYHPYFEACINKPISLPEPKQKEIKSWIETFMAWIETGFTVKQVIDAAKEIRRLERVIARPRSITWKLNDLYGRAQQPNEGKPNEGKPTVLSQLRNGVLL